MPVNRGKQFELKVREDLVRSFPKGYIYRLPDQMSYYKGSGNPCDILFFIEGNLFLIEAKSVNTSTFNIIEFAQYERLKEIKVKGVHPLVLIWFIEQDKVIAFPIESVVKMKEEDGLKSINVKTYMNYEHIEIPSIKKRVFMDSDYSVILKYFQEKEQ